MRMPEDDLQEAKDDLGRQHTQLIDALELEARRGQWMPPPAPKDTDQDKAARREMLYRGWKTEGDDP